MKKYRKNAVETRQNRAVGRCRRAFAAAFREHGRIWTPAAGDKQECGRAFVPGKTGRNNEKPHTADVARLVTCTILQVGFLSPIAALPTSAEAGGLHLKGEQYFGIP